MTFVLIGLIGMAIVGVTYLIYLMIPEKVHDWLDEHLDMWY